MIRSGSGSAVGEHKNHPRRVKDGAIVTIMLRSEEAGFP
jgi:hypothetical protein